MSKIGRKPIDIKGMQVAVDGQKVTYKGKLASGTYALPEGITVRIEDDRLLVGCDISSRDGNRIWGLHRALLSNTLIGASQGFEGKLKIVGLGYKGILKGKSLELSLGFSHKINYDIPEGATIVTDKTGQNLTVKSHDKQLVGEVCSYIRALRPPEPYKGTGVRLADEVILRKAGKTKAG